MFYLAASFISLQVSSSQDFASCGWIPERRKLTLKVYQCITCCGVEGAGIQPCQPESLLGGVYGSARHHDLGHPGFSSSLYHLVQVSTELLVRQVCTNVNNDVIRQFVQHCLWGILWLIILLRNQIFEWSTWVSCSNFLSMMPEDAMIYDIKVIIIPAGR